MFSTGGALLLAAIVIVMMAVPAAAVAVGFRTLDQARQRRASDRGAAPPETDDRDRLLGGWGGWRGYGVFACSVAGAALSGGSWLYRHGSSQARGDLQLAVPFFASLGFFGGFVVGVVLVGLLTQLGIGSRPDLGVDEPRR